MISLYPDQEEFVCSIRDLWRAHKRIVGLAPTGFGKTRVAARILEGHAKRRMKTCFIVPRVSLMEQTAKAFIELGLDDITYLWAGHDYRPGAMITIASADTYIRREKGDFALTIVDECHLRRKQLLEWMEAHPDDRYLGLSGTPYAPWIGEYYTALAKSKPMRWLIDNGRLSDYEVYAPAIPDLSGLKVKAGAYGDDYQENDLAAVMGDAKIVGNIVQNWLEHGENRLTIALCVNVLHANQVCIEFNRAGVHAEVITADTPIVERERIFARMRAGITRVITSVNALTEGLDIKEISCVINARPTRSAARYIQGMGRGLRVAAGKTNCISRDSLILTDKGEVKIQHVTLDHKVWDGVNFVQHAGAICKGVKHVIEYDGLIATPEHMVMTHDGWKRFEEAASRQLRIARTGFGGSPIRFTENYHQENRGFKLQLAGSRALFELQFAAYGAVSQHEEKTINQRLPALQSVAGSRCAEMGISALSTATRQMHERYKSCISALRGAWNKVQLREPKSSISLDSRESWGSERQGVANRQNKQCGALRSREFALVKSSGKSEQHKEIKGRSGAVYKFQEEVSSREVCRQHVKEPDLFGANRPANTTQMGCAFMQAEREVWDILNAGPLRRFTANGRLVHNCVIFDHSGTTILLGMPEDIQIDELNSGDDGMGKASRRIDDDKPEKKPSVCPQCKFMKPAGMCVCAKCGFKPLAGKDVEAIERIGLAKVGKGKKKDYTQEEKQYFYSELLGYQRERESEGRPISDGWVSNQYRNKFGVWPSKMQRIVRPPSISTRQYIRSQFIRFAKSKEKVASHV